MSRRNLFKHALQSLLLILVGMLVGWALSTGSTGLLLNLNGPSSAQAAANSPSTTEQRTPSVPEVPEGEAWYQCTSVAVAVYANRIHVECSVAAPGGIRFFALGTANSSHAARILSVLSMAHVTGKDLRILYDPDDSSGDAIGCQASDCRLIDAAIILP